MHNAGVRLAVLAAAGLLVGGLGLTAVPTAQADPPSESLSGAVVAAVPKTAPKSSSTVIVAPSMTTRLRHAHLSLKALAPASKHTDAKGRVVLKFPTSGARPIGTAITHQGGLSFTKSSKKLRLDAFRLNLNTKKLSARVDRSGRADAFLVTPGRTGADVSTIRLSAVTARLLNAESHTKRFTKGQKFGTVQLPTTLLGSDSGTTGMTINIQNNTRFTLNFVSADTQGLGQLTSTPKRTLIPDDNSAVPPEGAVDTITYASDNSHGGEVDLTYRIDGSELTVVAKFFVPILGANAAECGQGAFVDYAACAIGSGWHPTVTWKPTTNTAKAPFPDLGYGSGVWQFHPIVSGAKSLQVNNASTADGAVVSVSETTTQQHFQWRWQAIGNQGWGTLMNVATLKCLERNGQTGVIDQWDCTGGDNQLWRSVWNPSGGSALQLSLTNQYLAMSPGPVNNGAVPVLQNGLDGNASWGANTVG